MPVQEALMTGAELATTRAFLGFSQSHLAAYLWDKLPERDSERRPNPRTKAELYGMIERHEQRIEATQDKIAECRELIAKLDLFHVETVGELPPDEQPEPPEPTSDNLLRRLQRMEKGEAAVPAAIMDEIDDMYEVANNLVNNLVLQYKAKMRKAESSSEEVVLYTQRDSDKSGRYPACWHRAVCARVAAQVPGLVIEYDDDATG